MAATTSTNKWSGTEYQGETKNQWSEGVGSFRFPNGVVYEGQFHKGEFHGDGALVYPNGGRYVAKWERGFAVEGHYVFNDGLLYEDKNWQYVSAKDRRFYTEVKEGLMPAGQTYLTNDKQPPEIPVGCYDTGNGYFDPESDQIISYDGSQTVGIPSQVEIDWIKQYCRMEFPKQEEEAAKE